MPLIQKGKTNWQYTLTVVIFGFLVTFLTLRFAGPTSSQLPPSSISPPSSSLPSKAISPEEYTVYSALFKSEAVDFVILRQMTDPSASQRNEETSRYLHENLPSVEEDTLNNFFNQNQQEYSLSRRLPLPKDYVLIAKTDYQNIFEKENGWEEFLEKYPNFQGITSLSRVGFNSSKNQALVFEKTQLDWQETRAFYLLLEKENGTWVIKKQILALIS